MTIRFEAALREANGQTIVELPGPASKQLPSRGQVAARGTLNGHPFKTVIEPDGNFGHWIRVKEETRSPATIELEPTQEWPEPRVPPDLKKALSAAPEKIRALWQAITPMARWEWVRWVNETRNAQTRKRRVEVSISKLSSGKRRPCCFNLAACTDPDLSRSGKLISQAQQDDP